MFQHVLISCINIMYSSCIHVHVVLQRYEVPLKVPQFAPAMCKELIALAFPLVFIVAFLYTQKKVDPGCHVRGDMV